MSTFYAATSYRLEDQAIRPGMSPSDLRVIVVPNVVLVSGGADIDLTSFLPANTVVLSYWYAKRATTSSKVLAVAKALPGDSDTVDVFIVGQQTKFQ